MLAFDEIPYDWLKPGVYMEVKPSYDRAGAVPYPARTILFVQQYATGSAAPKKLYRITRPDQGAGLFGAGSVGDDMVRFYKGANKTGDLYAIGLADAAAGIAATGTITFAGTSTLAGPLALYIGAVRIPLAISNGQTAAQVATAAAAAINAVPGLPLTATAAAAVVTLTARHKGEVGNGYHLAVARQIDDTQPPGLTTTIVAMSGGATNPVVQDLTDVIASQWFTDIALPWDDSTTLSTLAGNLATRYTAMGKLDAHAYVGHRGTFSGLTAKGALTNSAFISGIGAKNSPTPPWCWAASLAGVCAFQLTNDPARQLRGLVLPSVLAPAGADQFIETEQNLLLGGGVSTFGTLVDGTVTLDRVVTQYKVSNLNVPDRAWLDIMVPKTASRVRYDWQSYVSLVYPRSKLADDDSLAAKLDASGVIVTPRRMLGTWGARCSKYEEWGWIENSADTLKRSVFERDAQGDRNRLNGRQPIQIIGNLMVLAGSLEFEV